MTSLFRSRHDAEELHDALLGHAAPGAAERHAELLRTVALLTTHPVVTPRPEFSAQLRERLLAAAETDLVAAPAPERRTTPSTAPSGSPVRRRLATVAASLVVVGGTAGMAAAAQGALPGDPLYPLKRGGEEVVAALSPGSDGAADLRRAATRLEEAQALQERGADTDLVAGAVEEFRSYAGRGADGLLDDYRSDGDPASVTEVRDFTAAQLPLLEALAASDPAVEPSVLEAADLLGALDDEARTLCAACGSADALSLPASLSQAGGAASLESLLTAPAQQARLDAEALSALDAAQIRALGQAAEQQAGTTPLPGDGSWPVVDTSVRGPVSSTLVAGAGEVVDGTVAGVTGAVDGLVGGLRDSAGKATGSVPGAGALDDTVDQALGGVSGVTGKLGKLGD